MKTPSDILNDLGGPDEVARATAIAPSAVLYWARRQSIPSRHWPKLIDLAQRKRVPGVNPTALLRANEAAR
jgi:hypothetical protein